MTETGNLMLCMTGLFIAALVVLAFVIVLLMSKG